MNHQPETASGVRILAASVLAAVIAASAAADEGPEGPRFVGFGEPVDLGVAGPPIDVDAGDVNGDGIVDVLAASAGGFGTSVRIWLGTPDGGFAPQSAQVSAPTATVAIRLADVDADGALDLALADGNGSVLVRWNAGDGSFNDGVAVVPVPGGPVDLDAGSADGDATADLYVGSADGTVTLIPGAVDRELQASATVPVGGVPASIATGDFDGDGDDDLVVGLDKLGWVRLVRTGGRSLQPATTVTGVGSPVAVSAGDLAGDPARDDVATVTAEGMLMAWESTGGFDLTPVLETPVGVAPSDVRIADLDEDGDGDLLAAEAQELPQTFRLRAYVQDPDGFAELMPVAEDRRMIAFELADLDGNTSLDLVGLVDDGEFRLVRTRINITDIVPPGPFDLAFPPDGQTGLPRPSDLVWEGATARLRWTEAAGFVVTYRVRIADNPEMIDPVIDVDGLEDVVWDVPMGTLEGGFTWYWTVEACSAAGVTTADPTVAEFSLTCREDLDGNGVIDVNDISQIIEVFGQVCGG